MPVPVLQRLIDGGLGPGRIPQLEGFRGRGKLAGAGGGGSHGRWAMRKKTAVIVDDASGDGALVRAGLRSIVAARRPSWPSAPVGGAAVTLTWRLLAVC